MTTAERPITEALRRARVSVGTLYDVKSDDKRYPNRWYRVSIQQCRCECLGYAKHRHCKHIPRAVKFANFQSRAAIIGNRILDAERDVSKHPGRGELLNWWDELYYTRDVLAQLGEGVRAAERRAA